MPTTTLSQQGQQTRSKSRGLKVLVGVFVTLVAAWVLYVTVNVLFPSQGDVQTELLYGFRTRALLVLTKLEGHTESETELGNVDSTPSILPGVQRPIG